MQKNANCLCGIGLVKVHYKAYEIPDYQLRDLGLQLLVLCLKRKSSDISNCLEKAEKNFVHRPLSLR